MSLYPIPECRPKLRHTLIDFMSAEEFETLKSAPKFNPLRQVPRSGDPE